VLECPRSTRITSPHLSTSNYNTNNLSSLKGICRLTLISAATLQLQLTVPDLISSGPIIPKFFPTIPNLRRFSRCRLDPESLSSRKQRQHSILLPAQWVSVCLVWASRVNHQTMYVTSVGMSHRHLLTGYFPLAARTLSPAQFQRPLQRLWLRLRKRESGISATAPCTQSRRREEGAGGIGGNHEVDNRVRSNEMS
jgi:hypothetical protein